jgi:hypothetical protein
MLLVLYSQWCCCIFVVHSDVIRVQCVARGFVASLELNRLKEEKKRRVEDMATKISSVWKGFCSQAAFRRTVKSIVLCQSLARCFLASKALQTLKHEHVMTSAALIQGQARGITVRKYFVSLKCSTIVVQSLARRRAASRYLQYLKEEQRIREAEMASKIAAVWKGFRIRSGHIYILLGTLMIYHIAYFQILTTDSQQFSFFRFYSCT